jgi:hypothetical protein
MSGLCKCGCGAPAPIAKQTRTAQGYAKGQPMHYVAGHQRRLSPVEYIAEDRGYSTPCWIWQRHITTNGYGAAYPPGRSVRAHRLVYERHGGVIPPGLDLDHLCRVRACVNPEHLEPVTRATNARRGARAKLTLEDVAAIMESPLSHRRLAKQYGVGKTLIGYYKSGQYARVIGGS